MSQFNFKVDTGAKCVCSFARKSILIGKLKLNRRMKGSMIHIVYISCHNFGIVCEITSKMLIVSMNFFGRSINNA